MSENTEYGIVPSFRPEEYVWIRQQLHIDQLRIDEEVMHLPGLVQKAGEYNATALEIQEASENDLKVTTSLISEQLRSMKNEKGRFRSETQITSEVPLSPQIAEKQESLSKARLDARLWATLLEALRKKDSAIRTVVDLMNSGLISTSSIIQKRRQEIRNASKQEVS